MTDEDFLIDADEILCDDEATLTAQNAFKIKYMFPWQRLVVANILDAYNKNEETNICENEKNDDTDIPSFSRQIVLLPTGAGKSLCFQVPALLLEKPTLVIYPLLALMSDQERRMIAGNLSCVTFKGGQTHEEREELFRKIEGTVPNEPRAKIIIANPEVLTNPDLLERLSSIKIGHIAIDEAHCVSEWGETFRPAYLELGKIIKKINAPVVTAFTATASPEVLAKIGEVLFEGKAHIVRSESDRPNIHYYVKKTNTKKKTALFLSRTQQRPMIIFCATRKQAEDMSREINTAFGKDESRFYHAGLEKEEKTEIEKWFFEQKDAVLCATCAYGMGVDKKDIHTVIHLDVPQTAEAYIQEAGRGGRDGSVSNAILLWSNDDEKIYSTYEQTSRAAVLKKFATTTDCRRQILLEALGSEENVVCSGCDICDKKNQTKTENSKRIIAEELPTIEDDLLNIIKKGEKYYTKQTIKEKYLPILNNYARKFTKVNIFYHEDIDNALNALQEENKIKILNFPWKGKLTSKLTKKQTNKIIFHGNHHQFLRHLLRSPLS